eukprot:TRINITY_DN9109_c0_g1_i5.p3 TRINITY_DN9109_c0_g1~~TRINITY_DN9109_c0_g1_i5.p3  ORF type:complete len:125 (-),score=29.46 TRINITY_DN9109_c0_g1_i5:961-1335(-)
MNGKSYIKYTLIYLNGLALLVLRIFNVNQFLSDNIHFFLLGLYVIFVIYAIISERTRQVEEPQTKTDNSSNPILIELQTIEKGRNVSAEPDELGSSFDSLEIKELRPTQNGGGIKEGTKEIIIK